MKLEIPVGETAEGNRVTVEIALRPLTHDRMTVTHELARAIDGLTELSITGNVYERYRNDIRRWRTEPYRGGQCVEALLEVVTPAKPWTLEEIRDLHDTWRRWHLNGMRAGCVHQTKIVYEDSRYGRRVDLARTTAANDCPAGYRYGHAWLYEPLPDEVIEKVQRWQRRAERRL